VESVIHALSAIHLVASHTNRFEKVFAGISPSENEHSKWHFDASPMEKMNFTLLGKA